MKYDYDLLVEAICLTGYWSWWSGKFPENVAVEFGNTQLWNPPIEEGQPPDHQDMAQHSTSSAFTLPKG